MTSFETHLFNFLEDIVEDAAADTPLDGCVVHDTPHQKMSGDKGLRVWDGESALVPTPGNVIAEKDGSVLLVCFVKVPGTTPRDRLDSRDAVVDLAAAVIKEIHDDNTLGSRVCDCEVGMVPRSYVNIGTVTYAVANIPLLINASGERGVDQ